VEFLETKPKVLIFIEARCPSHMMNLFAKKYVDDVSVVCMSKLPEINSFNRIRAF